MNTALCQDQALVVQDQALVVAPDELTELVRGDEQCLVQRVAPLLREKDVILDLNRIERIDAAGIAALISLYSLARTYGHNFSVKCVSPRVAEMLTLVRLNNVLISHNAVFASQCEAAFERPAA
jgi:anti-anti-sigma factor